jgi:hypothetical protein
MFKDPQEAFVMFLLCYAQCLSYLLGTMFPSLIILQHYVKFDIRIIITLEKLLGVGTLGGSIGHLIHHHAIFLTSLNEINILSII